MGLYVLAVFLNFLVNFFLLIGTNQVLGEVFRVKAAVLAAVMGGAYAALSLCWPPLGHTLCRLCVISFMSKIAFGRFYGRSGILFMVLQLAVSGIAAGLYGSGVVSVILTAMGICAVYLAGVWEKRTRLVPVELCHNGKIVVVTALRDTGNTLHDPLTGRPVLILEAEKANELTGLTFTQLRNPVETLSQNPFPGLRLLPYHTIDNPDGLLLGFWVKKAKIGKRKGGVLVAFAPENFSEGGKFQALTGGME